MAEQARATILSNGNRLPIARLGLATMVRRLLISLGIGGLVFLAAYGLLYIYSTGIFVGWQPLGAPPDGAGELVQVSIDWPEGMPPQGPAVYLAAADGGYWRGARSQCAAGGATCWAAAAELSQNSDGAELTVSPRYSSQNGYWLGAPPGAVVSCARYSEMLFGSHMLYEGHVALLEDGCYWVWDFTPGQTPLLIFICGILLAFLAALVAFCLPLFRTPNPSP